MNPEHSTPPTRPDIIVARQWNNGSPNYYPPSVLKEYGSNTMGLHRLRRKIWQTKPNSKEVSQKHYSRKDRERRSSIKSG
jgi:hypothetical protein